MKKVRGAKFYAVVLAAVLFAGILCNYAFSSLMSSVVIQSSGLVSTNVNVNAVSGSASDIQTAVNIVQAAGGGTVHVPAGTFYWNGETVTIPGGVNVIGASDAGCQGHETGWANNTASTILHNNAAPPNVPTMFVINGGNGLPTRISGIQFEATAPANMAAENGAGMGGDTCVILRQVHGYRIDHCTFINFCNAAVSPSANDGRAENTYSCYGVIDHCVCTAPYKLTTPPTGEYWAWAYGFYSIGNIVTYPSFTKPVTDFFGKYGAVAGYSIMFVEDCHFSYMRHCTDAIQGGYNVVRYNLMEDPACGYWIGMADIHGPQYGGWGCGARGQEVYNNTFTAWPHVTGGSVTEYPWLDAACSAFQLRSGAGLCFNNTYTGNGNTGEAAAFATLSNGDDPSGHFPDMGINQTYIWNNTYTGCNQIFNYNPSVIALNANYFLRAPSQAQDGFTYTPYSYPHPLTLSG